MVADEPPLTDLDTSGWTMHALYTHTHRLIDSQVALLTEMIRSRASARQVSVLKASVNAIGELMEARFVTFRVLVESQAEKVALALTASKEAIDKAEIATSKAIDKAEIANDKRFAAVNEFRAQLADQQATYITRLEVEAADGRLSERINELSARLERAERGT